MTNIVASLLDLIARWFGSEELQEEYSLQEYLEYQDYDDLDAIELYEAIGLYFDTLPVSVQRQQGDFSRDYNTGPRVNVHQHVELPPPPKHGDDWESVDEYVTYLTNNYTFVEDNDTILDNSVNQQIFADGDVNQRFDNDPVIASGDGAVAAGDDIRGPVVTGDDNLVGDGNIVATGGGIAAGDDIEDSQLITGKNSGLAANRSNVNDAVVGDDNQVAQDSTAVGFGDGDVSQAELRNVTVDDGGALAVGGNARGDNDERVDNSVHIRDSYNQDNDTDNSVEDSFNTDNSVEDSGNVDDSFNRDNDVIEIGDTDIAVG
jgi:hypothetical protein